MGTCSIEGCAGASYIRGWCTKHYQRWQNLGEAEGHAPRECQQCHEEFRPALDRAKFCSRKCSSAFHYRKNRARLLDPARMRSMDLMRHYGITVDEYDSMLEAQRGGCAICGENCATGRRLAVDHNHETGHVRGLLCTKCNTSLGNANDDPDRLIAMAFYLVAHAQVEESV